MAEKLIKVCKELNIGIDTITAWCENNGYSIGSDPNTMIDDNIYLHIAEVFRPHLVPTILEQLEAKKTERIVPKTGTFKLNRPLMQPPQVLGRIDISQADKSRFYHPDKDRREPDPRIEEQLKELPWSCGVVSVFKGEIYGVIIAKDGSESFFHPGNCDDEKIEDREFVFFKSLYNAKKEKYRAYHIRRPKIEDGYKEIFDFFWGKSELLDLKKQLPAFLFAISKYAAENWQNDKEDYTKILTDLKPYLIISSSEYVLVERCNCIIRMVTDNWTPNVEINKNFFAQLADIVFPELNEDCLYDILRKFAFQAPYHKLVFSHLSLLSSEMQEKFIASLLGWDCVKAAEYIIPLEKDGLIDKSLSRKCFYSEYKSIREDDKVKLYFMGFDDDLRQSLSHSIIVQYLIHIESASIADIYNENKIDREDIIGACCGILRNAASQGEAAVKANMQSWASSMPDILVDALTKLASRMDYSYLLLWRYGVMQAPSVDAWARLLQEDSDAFYFLIDSFRNGQIDEVYYKQIIQHWYGCRIANLDNQTPQEQFKHDLTFYHKFKSKISDDLLKSCSEYFPIIKWYQTVFDAPFDEQYMDISQLSKYFYLFSNDDQTQIIRFLFYLHANKKLNITMSDLKKFTSDGQRLIAGNNDIHVCFSIDLVLEAIIYFDQHKEFLPEPKLLELVFNTQKDTDYRDGGFHNFMLYAFFHTCNGMDNRVYVDEKIDGKTYRKEIQRYYPAPKGVIFCEGRKMAQKDERGLTRYLCRNHYCYYHKIKLETKWQSYTMYDFCHILNFDMKDADKAGMYSDDGKYLKFMALLNRFIQFADHLYCRECGRIRKPSNGMSNLAVTVSSYYECYMPNCPENGKAYYLSHCLNKRCNGPIDGRDSKACPNNWLICPQCASCCSTNVFENRYRILKENEHPVPSGLDRAVRERIGHAEKGEYFCYQCGSPLTEMVDRRDIDHACTNPDCRATYVINSFYQSLYSAYNPR